MNAQTQSAPVRHWHADAGATTPRLTGKARNVDPIMHDRLARREQRRASRQNRYDTARRLARVELELTGLTAQVTADSIVLGTTSVQLSRNPGAVRFTPTGDPEPDYRPPAGHPEAESLPLGAQDDVMLAGWSLDLWPCDEFTQITAESDLS